jgi:hypothetical protein
MPATRDLASKLTSFPRVLLVKSSWAFTPSTLFLRSDFGLLLRPIPAEHDPDHDHRAGRNRQRADHRQLFEDSDNGCPPANFLSMRGAPPCHTHTETPFGPQQQCGLSVRARLRHF